MKAAFKKLASFNRTTIIRSIFFSVVFLAVYVVVLYILINSPA